MPKFRFGILLLLIVVTMFTLVMAYISFKRDRGTDKLVTIISRTKDREEVEITAPVPYSMGRQEEIAEYQLGSTEPEVKNSVSQEKTFIDRLLGNASAPVAELNLSEALIDERYARQLGRNHAATEIGFLRLRSCDVKQKAEPFFQNWNLKRLVIHNTQVPENWVAALATTSVDELAIIGDCGHLTVDALVEQMAAIGNKEQSPLVVQVCNGVTTARQIEQWNKKFPPATFQAVAFIGRHIVENAQPLSQADPHYTRYMELTWKQIHQELANLDPPALNRFNPPATDAEITELENCIGIPLHPTFRAYLKVHNGQPSMDDELVMFEKLLSIKEIISHYGEWQGYSDMDEVVEYDFNPDYDSWVNPNVIPVGTSEDHIIGVNQITGRLVYWYSEQRNLDYVADDIQQYFENIVDLLKKREFGNQKWPKDFRNQKIRVWRL